MKKSFLCGMDPEHFLRNFWNKQPCIFRGAVPEAKTLATSKDLIKMGLNPDFETRMVIESGGDYPWQAKLGPFNKKDFKKDHLWTLICHNLELCDENFYNLKKKLNYIPDWNFDDIMATVSNKGSSVGAHIDDYSVFIIQGVGKRRWLIEENPKHGHLPNLDIKLLSEFNPKTEWILEPGDMIYLPPNVAHHGISLEDSVSYSIGFKSIRYNQMIVNYAMDIMNDIENESYSDNRNDKANDPFVISTNTSKKIYNDLMILLSDKKRFEKSMIKYLSKPKNETIIQEDLEDEEALYHITRFKLKRDPWVKLVGLKKGKNKIQISINQKIYFINALDYKTLKTYFEISPFSSFKISSGVLSNATLKKVLMDCYKNGFFFLA